MTKPIPKPVPKPGRPVRGSRTGRAGMALFDLLGRRWALRVIWELRDGRRLNFRDLLAACEISPGVLNARLAELRETLIVAHGEGGYALTAQGASLLERLMPLQDWAEGWAKSLK
ncbi:MAG TPA: helix-turn-helix domain-containing protein [Rhizomicrobium sp.]|jgi:DNA-binding HxlR family transcriptional regulator